MSASTLMSNDRREAVRESISNASVMDLPYVAMNILATIIACYGLLANSPAVVIGAMVVAMLLGPITGVALALVDSNISLLRKALTTLIGGIIGVMVTAFILGLIHKEVPITNEIMSRTSPNLFDLMVALAGGAAGAYATVSPRLSVAFVGVAIATALVPPFSAASILFARGEYKLGFEAVLLACTNIVGIQFASSCVLWLTGFRTITQGRNLTIFFKRNIVGILIIVVLAIILVNNLHRVIAKKFFETSVNGIIKHELSVRNGYNLAGIRFETKENTTIIRALVRGPNSPIPQQVADLDRTFRNRPAFRRIIV